MKEKQAAVETPAWWRGASGPTNARLYHMCLAACALVAWLSLGSQVQLLIGSRGLLPLAPLVDSFARRAEPLGLRFPSLLVFDTSDAAITAGVVLGTVLAIAALIGVAPRLCLLASAPLYLSYAVAGREFMSLQWDDLLVECLVLATFLPRDRPSPATHWLMRLLLFKLYFESGIAKAQSHLGDWFDGSAMTFYYETAPLPAWPGWYAHHLPEVWHHLESWSALGLESLGAFLILGPRPARLAALAGFSGFQLINLATANYGFFVYLALALHVFLLDESDLRRLRLPRWPPFARRVAVLRGPRAIAKSVGRPFVAVLAAAWVFVSVCAAFVHFTASPPRLAKDVYRATGPFRVANAYHLFGHITRERIEPEFQTLQAGAWQPHAMHYKPGNPADAPPLVAPHQPRVDFRLWFHGLRFRERAPPYVRALLRRLCTDPTAVQALFPAPLPAEPVAARVAYFRHHFTTPVERRESGDWWTRELVSTGASLVCATVPR